MHGNDRNAGNTGSDPRNPQCHQARPDGRAKANPLAVDVPHGDQLQGVTTDFLRSEIQGFGVARAVPVAAVVDAQAAVAHADGGERLLATVGGDEGGQVGDDGGGTSGGAGIVA